jgi:hypothetical protein
MKKEGLIGLQQCTQVDKVTRSMLHKDVGYRTIDMVVEKKPDVVNQMPGPIITDVVDAAFRQDKRQDIKYGIEYP